MISASELWEMSVLGSVSPLKVELNPICHLLALLRAHHILHISRIKVIVGYSPQGQENSGNRLFSKKKLNSAVWFQVALKFQ